MKPIIVSAMLIGRKFGSETRYLLGKKLNGAFKGSYDTPGGKLEDGELTIDCAERELFEEAGMHTTRTRFLRHVEVIGKRYHYIVFLYLGESMDEPENLEPDKHKPWEWVRITKDLKLMPSLQILFNEGFNGKF